MKLISETLTELGIAFTLPIIIEDANGKVTYYESSRGDWEKRERDANGDETYYEDSTGYWARWEYDANRKLTYFEHSDGDWEKWERDTKGNVTYRESSDGLKSGTPRSNTNQQLY